MIKSNYKILMLAFLFCFVLLFTGCSMETDEYFNEDKLKEYYLYNLPTPQNASKFKTVNKSNLFICYMDIDTDNSIESYVREIIESFKNNEQLSFFGYSEDIRNSDNGRYIIQSLDIDDYRLGSRKYSPTGVTSNSYYIYYSVDGLDGEKAGNVYELSITSYTEDNQIKKPGFNLSVSITRNYRYDFYLKK